MKTFDYRPSTRVVFGEKKVIEIGEIATELEAKRAMIVTDPGIVEAGHVDCAKSLLQKNGIEVFVFSDVRENPTTEHVGLGVQAAHDFQPDLIVGLGGGSSMDCAKGVNFLFTNGGEMQDYWGFGKANKRMLPSIGVPTTAGTGSEAQSYALISDESTHVKMACGDRKARFKAVILDPELVLSAPLEVRAVTGMDAISHAVESYVSTKRNRISKVFSKEAWRLLSTNYEASLAEKPKVEVLEQMLLGAHFAGAAIENSMLGAAHACSNPLTAKFGITHGIAVGLMLPHVVKFNSTVVNGDYVELLLTTGEKISGSDSAARLCEHLNGFLKAATFESRLQKFGVSKSVLPELANQAAEQWTGKFNPRKASESDFLKLYETAY